MRHPRLKPSSIIGLVGLFLLALASSSCATPAEKLKLTHLGMTGQEVTNNVGKPNLVRGTLTNRFGQQIEVWEYEVAFPDEPGVRDFKVFFSAVTFGLGSPVWLVQNTKTYWFYFVDSRLARWAEAGDWDHEVERLYELPWKLLEPLGPG